MEDFGGKAEAEADSSLGGSGGVMTSIGIYTKVRQMSTLKSSEGRKESEGRRRETHQPDQPGKHPHTLKQGQQQKKATY